MPIDLYALFCVERKIDPPVPGSHSVVPAPYSVWGMGVESSASFGVLSIAHEARSETRTRRFGVWVRAIPGLKIQTWGTHSFREGQTWATRPQLPIGHGDPSGGMTGPPGRSV